MVFFNDTYRQIFGRLIAKEQWNKHLYFCRHLQVEVEGYSLAYFPQRNPTRDESSTLEKAFWEMIFGSVDVLPVYGFLKTYFLMVTIMKDYLTIDDNDDDADFRHKYRDTMIAQFKQDLYNKFSTFKIKVNVTKLILSRTELNFGSMFLLWHSIPDKN